MNILIEIDDLDPNFCPAIEVLSNFMNFGTKNKRNIRIDIDCLDSGKFCFKTEMCSLVIHKTRVKSQRTVRKLRK